MNKDEIEKMLIEAKAEINTIERKMVELTARRDMLWRFITSSREVIDYESGKTTVPRSMVPASEVLKSSTTLGSLIAPNASSVFVSAGRLWEAVQLVMRVAKRPLTVPEIAVLLEKHKILVGGDHPRENIRSAMNRREDIFEKQDRGLYLLKEWPDSIKQLRKDENLLAETLA